MCPQIAVKQQLFQAAERSGWRKHIRQRHRMRQNQAADLPQCEQNQQAC
ncbi:hypothetical protein [Kingella kingae]|nr:hypothetical protein [Kingella kingae]MDK4574809.1 hypothetical protein [Kingella kingae]MDK4607216.1 hypothetical protein [Kingella kingae]